MVARFSFRTEGGHVAGPVRGCGGMVDSFDKMQAVSRLAFAGKSLGIYEPKPGYVAVFPDYSAAGDGEPVIVAAKAFTHQLKTREEKIAQLEASGAIDPKCPGCEEQYAHPDVNAFAPRHKASPFCKSGKHAHCTCDTCF